MIGVLAIAATFVIGAAGLDLSLGSVLGLPVWSARSRSTRWPALAPRSWPACRRRACGPINGLLITRAGIPAFIVTLGMLGVARGAGLVLTNGLPVYGLPDPLVFLGQGRPFGIPMPVPSSSAVALMAHFMLAYTRFGNYALVIGDNEAAARAMGIHVGRIASRSTSCRARWPVSPACSSWRGSMPATRPPASTTS